jgi:signal transduction histidine kinase
VFGGWVVLSETGTATQLLNTRRRAGDPLPGPEVAHALVVESAERQSARIGQPVLSDTFLGPVAGTRVATFITVLDAVSRPSGTPLSLSFAFDVSELSEFVADLPHAIAVVVLDGSGAVVAQSRSGLPGPGAVSRLHAIAPGADGSWVRESLELGDEGPSLVLVRSLEGAPGWTLAVLRPARVDIRATSLLAATHALVVFALAFSMGLLVLAFWEQKRLTALAQQRQEEREYLASETERVRSGAAAGERAKSNLLWLVGHELRTPLNGVVGALDLLGRESLNQEVQRYLDLAQSSGRRLRMLIEIALDLLEIDLQRVVQAQEPFDPHGVAEAALSTCRRSAGLEHVKLEILVPPDLPRHLDGDGPRIVRALEYLVCHAIDIAEADTIGVAIEWTPIDDRRGEIRFVVTDSGAGFSRDELALLSRDIAGLDPGDRPPLCVIAARKLIDLMGGALEVSSTPGLGSRFSFSLVVARGAPDRQGRGATR